MATKLQQQNEMRKVKQLDAAVKVARLYCQGMSQKEIADHFDIHWRTVQDMIRLATDLWKAELLKTADEIKAAQLAKVDALEAAAWEGWRRSQLDSIEVTEEIPTSIGDDGEIVCGDELQPVQRKRKGQSGDSHFLNIISKAIDQRLRILGIFKQNNEPGGDDHNGGAGGIQLLEVVVSTRQQAAEMLPFLDFKKDILDAQVISSESRDDGPGNNLPRG